MTFEADVVIIGAGPAGMSAAGALHKYDCKVVILDEQVEPGGQIYKAIESVSRDRPEELSFLGPAYNDGIKHTKKFRSKVIDYRPRSTVWHIGKSTSTNHYDVFYSCGGISKKLSTKYIVLASGAMERPVPLPGWTLPGVMTIGAAQSALKTSGVYPAGNLVLAGSGPLVLQFASQLIAAEVQISAIVDTAPAGALLRALRYLPRALLAFSYLYKGGQLMRKIKRSGVKVYRNGSCLRVLGNQRVQKLCFESNGMEVNLQADIVALHEGVIPNTQLTRLLDIKHTWSEGQRSFSPIVDSCGESSKEGIFIVGDSAGVFGSKTAEYNGLIAGLSIAERLGCIKESYRDLMIKEKKLRRFLDGSIRPFLDALFPAPKWVGLTDDATIICRCEEVTAGEIRSVAAKGCSGPNQAKAFLRCGMGVCQGRMCGASVTEVMSQALGKAPSDVGSYRIRPPIKPLSLSEIASLSDE